MEKHQVRNRKTQIVIQAPLLLGMWQWTWGFYRTGAWGFKIKHIAQGHTTATWWTWTVSPAMAMPKLKLLYIMLFVICVLLLVSEPVVN